MSRGRRRRALLAAVLLGGGGRRRALLAVLLLGGAGGLGLAERPALGAMGPIQIHATLEPSVIGIDEVATLTVETQAAGLDSLHFQAEFSLDNLEAIDGPAQYEAFSVINGGLSRSFRMSWHLRPRGLGPARVRGLIVRLRSEAARLPDQEIRVQEQPTGAPPAPRGGPVGGLSPDDMWEWLFGRRPFGPALPPSREPPVLLRAEVQPQRPVVGEQVLYTVYLYTQQDIAAIDHSEMPTFHGFWVRDIPQPDHLVAEPAAVGDVRYQRVPVLRKALFPLRPGRQRLEPAGMNVVLEPARSLFGAPIFRPDELHLRTSELAIDVQPLPPPPPGFGGAVGRLALQAALQPASLRLGEGATLTLTLAGAGNVQGVAAPRLALPAGLATYPPQQQGEERLSGTTIEGRRTWTYVLVPQRTGRYTLEPQGVLYFDPARSEYRIAETPPLALTALPAPPSAAGAGGGATLHSIRSAALRDEETSAARRWLLRWTARWPPLLGWFVLPWGLALVLVLARRGTLPLPLPLALPWLGAAGARNGGGPAAERSSRDGRSLERRLLERRLRDAASEPRPRHAAARMEEVWRDYLGTRWGVPAAAPPERWSTLLGERGADAGAAGELAGLAEDLHFLRYAPQLSATDTLRGELLARSRRLLRRLR